MNEFIYGLFDLTVIVCMVGCFLGSCYFVFIVCWVACQGVAGAIRKTRRKQLVMLMNEVRRSGRYTDGSVPMQPADWFVCSGEKFLALETFITEEKP